MQQIKTNRQKRGGVILWAGVFSLLFCSPVILARDTLSDITKRGVLKVGLEAGYMPFEMKDKQGNIIGFDVDIAKLIAKKMGVKLEMVNTEWDGIIPSLLTNKFDMIIAGMTVTPERNLRVNFSKPYLVVGQTILVRKGLAGKIKSYHDLNDKKYQVVSKIGTTGEQAIKKLIPKAKYRAYQTSQEAVLEVVNGRVDAFVYDLPFNATFVATKGKGKVIFLDQPFTYEPLAVAVRRGDPDILNWMNNFFNQIENDGTMAKLKSRWFERNEWQARVQ